MDRADKQTAVEDVGLCQCIRLSAAGLFAGSGEVVGSNFLDFFLPLCHSSFTVTYKVTACRRTQYDHFLSLLFRFCVGLELKIGLKKTKSYSSINVCVLSVLRKATSLFLLHFEDYFVFLLALTGIAAVIKLFLYILNIYLECHDHICTWKASSAASLLSWAAGQH